jgi:hypothetical protein
LKAYESVLLGLKRRELAPRVAGEVTAGYNIDLDEKWKRPPNEAASLVF